jgi:hypothetical protein
VDALRVSPKWQMVSLGTKREAIAPDFSLAPFPAVDILDP